MSSIMSYEDYLTTQADKEVPYFFCFGEAPHILYYLGLRHTYDFNDSQIPKIRAYWHEFLAAADKTNALVLVEAGRRLPLRDSEEEAIRLNAESGLMTYLGNKAGIPVTCPEPDRITEYKALREVYEPDQILFYYTARVVFQYFKLTDAPSLEEYIQQYIERDKQLFGNESDHYSWEYFKELAKQYNAPGYDKSSENFWYNIINPTQTDTTVNAVSRESSIFRDKHIANEIIRHYKDGKSLFITYGSTHVVMQEPYIKSVLNNKDNSA